MIKKKSKFIENKKNIIHESTILEIFGIYNLYDLKNVDISFHFLINSFILKYEKSNNFSNLDSNHLYEIEYQNK